jgi:hypothetical protein
MAPGSHENLHRTLGDFPWGQESPIRSAAGGITPTHLVVQGCCALT